ncbi:hypothetical protein PVAP13_6KG103470 [Panicum virgatum]|uniref:Uncharacterized protein n=1 Tax=Panicum virgatum TaxID=38727 RepID=A0A8T0RBZ1_PANVG|nr:hypothetical protein PVAP13_6KG103470 [Panicum virgatum]
MGKNTGCCQTTPTKVHISLGTKYNSKPRHVASCITKVISMSNIACQDHQRDTNDFSS